MKRISIPFGNWQIIYFPALLLIVLLFLFVFSLKIGISKISELQDGVNSQKENETILKQKEELLKSVEENVLDQANIANIALPEKNPVLLSLYWIKYLGKDGLVELSNIKVGSGSTDQAGINKISISFNLAGQIADVINGISQLKNVLPLIVVDKVDFQIEGPLANASVGVSSFWSPFPDKIPSLTQPLRDLTPEEKEILESLLSLTRPPFAQLLPQEPTENEDPFRE